MEKNMRIGIMQPYFLPYIGYFQLIAAVDKLVLLDDVNFINRGWINRNRIALDGKPHWLTLPLAKASQNRLINEIDIVDDASWRRKTMRMVEMGYARAPHAHRVMPLLGAMLEDARGSLSEFLFKTLSTTAKYIDLEAHIEPTSTIYPKNGLYGPERILDICTRESATAYVNLPGGRGVYDPDFFADAGIQLLFLDPCLSQLPLQASNGDDRSLSILDLMMFNLPSTVRTAAGMFRLEGR
jgi:hypothetical protein